MSKAPYNAEDPAAVRAAEDHRIDEEQDLVKIMETQRGRRWIYKLIHSTCHVDLPSHVPGDTHLSAFNEGARAAGLAVRLEAKMSPNYLKMMEENDD
jgi:hypothetical protein